MNTTLSRILFFTMVLLLSFRAADPAVGQAGTLDPAFGGDGTVTHEFSDWVTTGAVMLEPDGSMITIGQTEDNDNPANRSGTLVKFNADGTLAHSQTYPAGAFGCSNVPRAFLTASRLGNGELIAAGYRQTTCGGSPRVFEIFRMNAGGGVLQQYDPAEFYGQIAYAYAVAVQPDGKIVSAGFADQTSFDDTTRDIAMARHNADGTLDPDFGTDGEVTLDVTGDEDRINAIAIQNDGRIVAGGHARTTNDRDFLLMRFDSDGSLDTGFGTSGIVLRDFHGYQDRIWDLAVRADGQIVVVGRSTAADENTIRFTVMQFNADGSVDLDFATDGVALVDFGTTVASARALWTGPTGRLYVAGSIETGAGEDTRQAAMAVLRPDGTLDPAFGSAGITSFAFGTRPIDTGQAIDIDPIAGRIAVAGYNGETDIDENRFRDVGVARLIGFPDALFSDRFE